jgi:ATP-binding cassette subfamily B protein
MVWVASPLLARSNAGLRLVRAVLPVAALWVGKLIIDEVVRLSGLPARPDTVLEWWSGGEERLLFGLVLAELALAILSDLLGRITGLVDSLLSERLSVSLSIRLMDHAATLDLAQFENAGFQDRLERARPQASGRMMLLGQILGQLQDLVTVLTFAAGLVAYNPWLLLLLGVALVPAFLGEAHFNGRAYSLDHRRTPERRELDYVRQTAASVGTAKEVKIFGLNGFLRDRYRELSLDFYAANRHLARARAAWGALFAALGTVG